MGWTPQPDTPVTGSGDAAHMPSMAHQLSGLALKDMDPAALTVSIIEETTAMPGVDQSVIFRAISVASFLHRNQIRKNRGRFPCTPYIEHPLRCSLRIIRWGVTDQDIITAAILHDTVEDCADDILEHYAGVRPGAWSEAGKRGKAAAWIRTEFGAETARLILAVTNPPKPQGPQSKEARRAQYADHVRDAIAGDAPAFIIKYSDFRDNASGLHHNDVTGNAGMVAHLAAKYLPLTTIFATEYLDSPDLAGLVSEPAYASIAETIASSAERLERLSGAAA